MKFTGHYSYNNPKECIHEEDLFEYDTDDVDTDGDGDLL
jgi:hypothetical protein